MVGQRPLKPLIMVRIHVPQLVRFLTNSNKCSNKRKKVKVVQ